MKRGPIISGAVASVVLLVLGMWIGSRLVKQPTEPVKKVWVGKVAARPKPKPITTARHQVSVPAVVPIQAPVVPTPAAPQVQQIPPAPAIVPPAPVPVVPTPAAAPPRSIRILSGNSLSINILSSAGGGWASGVRVNGYGGYGSGPTRWAPGFQRYVVEDRPEGRVGYWTWEPAHYE